MVLSRIRRRSPASAQRSAAARAPPAELELGECAAQVVEDMAIALFVLDREGRVAVWNDACARLTGLEADKVVGGKDHWKGFYCGGASVSG